MSIYDFALAILILAAFAAALKRILSGKNKSCSGDCSSCNASCRQLNSH